MTSPKLSLNDAVSTNDRDEASSLSVSDSTVISSPLPTDLNKCVSTSLISTPKSNVAPSTVEPAVIDTTVMKATAEPPITSSTIIEQADTEPVTTKPLTAGSTITELPITKPAIAEFAIPDPANPDSTAVNSTAIVPVTSLAPRPSSSPTFNVEMHEKYTAPDRTAFPLNRIDMSRGDNAGKILNQNFAPASPAGLKNQPTVIDLTMDDDDEPLALRNWPNRNVKRDFEEYLEEISSKIEFQGNEIDDVRCQVAKVRKHFRGVLRTFVKDCIEEMEVNLVAMEEKCNVAEKDLITYNASSQRRLRSFRAK